MPGRSIRCVGYLACLAITCAAILVIYAASTWAGDEVVLTIGEPYEQVRMQSRSTLPPLERNTNWAGVLVRPAKLRFADPQYGFVTPEGKFFSVSYNRQGNVESLVLSPQVETLSLGDAMAILVNLQDQLRKRGWKPFHSKDNRPIEDTKTTRDAIRACSAPTTRWQAGDKYQVSLNIRCFQTDDQSNDQRFLITLDLGPPMFDDLPR